MPIGAGAKRGSGSTKKTTAQTFEVSRRTFGETHIEIEAERDRHPAGSRKCGTCYDVPLGYGLRGAVDDMRQARLDLTLRAENPCEHAASRRLSCPC